MRVLVTGAKGQLGFDLVEELKRQNIEVVPLDVQEMDITNEKIVTDVLEANIKNGLDSIIHCAAYTAVDKAEDEIELASKINVEGTRHIVNICKKYDIPLMYISTDYVFDGESKGIYKENDVRNPISIYGKTKCQGELLVETLNRFFIVRISWVFGIAGNNFVKTMLKLAKERDELSIVSDQVGSPTYTKDLSILLADMIQTDKYGIYHATNEEYCSWYEFAKEIFKLSNINIKLKEISSKDFITKAKRPANSKMSKEKLKKNNFNTLPTWKDALERYLKELNL